MSDGAYFAVGPCHICNRTFAYDPDTVPSYFVDPVDAHTIMGPDDPAMQRARREPVCYNCAETIVELRARRGLEDLWHGQWGTPI